MNRWLACLVPWMAMTVAWAAGFEPATVQFAYQPAATSDAFKRGDEAFVTTKLARTWGWNISARGSELEIAAEGRLFRVAAVQHQGQNLINLSESARFLGTTADWEGNVFRALARIRSISLTEQGLEVDSTVRVKAKAFRVTGPDRLVFDFAGAKLDTPEAPTLPTWWRVRQFSVDTARIVIEHPAVVAATNKDFDPSRSFRITIPDLVRQDPGTITQAIAPASTTPPEVVLSSPKITQNTDSGTILSVPTTARLAIPPAVRYLSPTEVQVSIPKAEFAKDASNQFGGSPWIKELTLSGDGTNAIIAIELNRPMAFTVTNQANQFQVRFFRPGGSASLMGKVIVIDPGHGGRDPGARYGTVNEKGLVLPIGLALAKLLEQEGASVIMTRTVDTYPSLGDRGKLANDSDADLFLSLHINSLNVENGRSGTITFHHKQEPVGRLLAECIQDEIAKVSGIPDLGAWSDQRIYQSGFKVLRDSKMPGVLIEFGFINHKHDRAVMTSKDFTDKMAKAVLRGIQVFFGEQH
ncbi:MAG: N-acetylmuramoyl-L-alanine amidase [Armatimonadetes bacterium]|nr:N-acetylmuramoyl-L-alanine amidase [Armatimonadota bacterium]